ncbi:MAG: oligosaccharide flippase family protein, partial [Candidatus Paceibacteria bacterium]
MGSKNKFVDSLSQQASITFLGKIIGKILGFLFIIGVTQEVSPKTYGLFTLAISLVAITKTLADLSFQQSIDYFIPKLLNEGDSRGVRSTVKFVFQITSL